MDKTNALGALAALANSNRLDVFRLLMRQAPDGLAAGEIARRLGVLQNTMSSHLAVLLRAGLVTQMRKGRVVEYAANFSVMRELLSFLMEDCCQGEPEICEPLLEMMACRR